MYYIHHQHDGRHIVSNIVESLIVSIVAIVSADHRRFIEHHYCPTQW